MNLTLCNCKGRRGDYPKSLCGLRDIIVKVCNRLFRYFYIQINFPAFQCVTMQQNGGKLVLVFRILEKKKHFLFSYSHTFNVILCMPVYYCMRNTFKEVHFSSFLRQNSPQNGYFSYVFAVFLIPLLPFFDYFFFIYTLCVPLPILSIPESGWCPHCFSSMVAAV